MIKWGLACLLKYDRVLLICTIVFTEGEVHQRRRLNVLPIVNCEFNLLGDACVLIETNI